MNADKKIVVTGGSGFIGSRIVQALRAEHYTVRTFDRSESNYFDITKYRAVRSALIGADTVIHLAGVLGTSELLETPALAAEVNTYGTANILQACEQEGVRFLGISMPDAFLDTSIYTITKTAGINIAKALQKANGLPVAHVRAFNAYGEGQHVGGNSPRKIIPAFACESYLDKPITIWGDGDQGVDLISSRQLANLFVKVVERGKFEGETYDGGTGEEFTVHEVANMVTDVTGLGDWGKRYLPMRRGETATRIVATGEGWDSIGWRAHFQPQAFYHAVHSYAAVVAGRRDEIWKWLEDTEKASLPR